MPLYNNILVSRKTEASGNEGDEVSHSNKKEPAITPSMKLLQDHLLSKRRSNHQQNISKQVPRDKQSTNESKLSQIIYESELHHRTSENDWDLEDEYDPMVPNSYEVLQAEYLQAEEEKSLMALKMSQSGSGKKIMPNLLDVLDRLDTDENDSQPKKPSGGIAIAPPPSLVSTSCISTSDGERLTPTAQQCTSPASASTEKVDGNSVAAKIMSKMGYKLGSGLGKDEQGISSPLEVERIGINEGRISIPNAIKKTGQTETNDQPQKDVTSNMAQLLNDSTRVLLLKNMVGPGEVDDDLEAETKEECKKYGEVIKCLIYEIPNKKVPDDEAVGIFVEFRDVESAIEAASDLNGRYFGGRIVRASFYSQEKFNKYDLNFLPASKSNKSPTHH